MQTPTSVGSRCKPKARCWRRHFEISTQEDEAGPGEAAIAGDLFRPQQQDAEPLGGGELLARIGRLAIGGPLPQGDADCADERDGQDQQRPFPVGFCDRVSDMEPPPGERNDVYAVNCGERMPALSRVANARREVRGDPAGVYAGGIGVIRAKIRIVARIHSPGLWPGYLISSFPNRSLGTRDTRASRRSTSPQGFANPLPDAAPSRPRHGRDAPAEIDRPRAHLQIVNPQFAQRRRQVRPREANAPPGPLRLRPRHAWKKRNTDAADQACGEQATG